MMFPSTACLVQHKIGARNAWGFDLSAACSAFTYALTTASQLVASGCHDHALVIGADVMSSIIDYKDRATCVLFGDGAGAVVVSAAADGEPSIIDFEHEIDGSGGAALCMPAGGSLRPPSHDTVENRLHYVKQDGQTVFKFAVRKTEEIARRIMERNNISASDLDLFVSHQANRRIIQAASEKLGIESSKVVINIERFGNTTAATIPLALNDAIERRASEEGRPRAAVLGRGGVHRGIRAAALGNLGELPIADCRLLIANWKCGFEPRTRPDERPTTHFGVVRSVRLQADLTHPARAGLCFAHETAVTFDDEGGFPISN